MTLFGANPSGTSSSGTDFDGLEDDRDRLDQRLPEGDPLAIFHRLPAPAAGGNEISAMKAAVAELRRARELSRRSDEISGIFPADLSPEQPLAEKAPARPRHAKTRRARAWRLPAAAAALFATALFFGGSGGGISGGGDLQPAAPVATEAALTSAPAVDGASYLPLVEDLDPRQAELIQIEDDGLSLVVVLAAGPI